MHCFSPFFGQRQIEQVRCLSHVFHDYLLNGNMRSALLAVLQQINIAEHVNTDMHEVSSDRCLRQNSRYSVVVSRSSSLRTRA